MSAPTEPINEAKSAIMASESGLLAANFINSRSTAFNYDRQQQTHSTIAELSEAFRMFTNTNGTVPTSVVTAADLQQIMGQAGMRTTEHEVAALIQAIDQNRIGNISFDEFASLMGRSVPMEEVNGMQAAFWGVDKERKGWITSNQFCELMASKGEQSSPDEVSEMLSFADPNNTGKVYYAVFLRMLGLRLT